MNGHDKKVPPPEPRVMASPTASGAPGVLVVGQAKVGVVRFAVSRVRQG